MHVMLMKRLLDNRSGDKGIPKTLFSFKKIKSFLVFTFYASDSSLSSYSDIDNGDLFNGDVVELFLDLGDDFYYEFEVAPNGKIFVAKSYNGKPVFIENNFFFSEVKIRKQSYMVKMRIDLTKLKETNAIKFNAFRIETKGIKSEYILQALSPTLSNSFHVRDKFISL